MRFIPKVSLHGSGEVVELSNGSHADFTLMQGSAGLGMGPREISTVALPSGGSLVRHRRGTESEVQLPILLGGSERKRWDLRRKLERLVRGEVEVRVTRSNGVYRSRFGYYKQGLEGSYDAGEDSPNGQKIVLEFLCPDEFWRGEEQAPNFKLSGLRKRFLSDGPEPLAAGAVMRRESRAPTADDAGNAGDVWLVGEVATPEKVLRKNSVSAPVSKWSTSAVAITGVSGGWDRATTTAADVTSYISSPSPYASRTPVSQGSNVAAIEVRVPSDAHTLRVRYGVFLYDANGAELQAERTLSAYLTLTAGDTQVIRVPFNPSPAVSGARILFYPTDEDGKYTVGNVVDMRTPYLGAPGDLFDGDTPASGGKAYRWADDGSSEEYVPASDFQATARYKHDGSKWVDVGIEMVSPFLPIVLSSSTVQGESVINIGGDAPVYPTWVIDGPGTDLIIENDKGQSIKVLTEFDEQVTITTNPLRQDITSPSMPDGELWEHVPTNSVFFSLEPGTQTVKMSMVGAKPNSLVRCLYRENYWAGW